MRLIGHAHSWRNVLSQLNTDSFHTPVFSSAASNCAVGYPAQPGISLDMCLISNLAGRPYLSSEKQLKDQGNVSADYQCQDYVEENALFCETWKPVHIDGSRYTEWLYHHPYGKEDRNQNYQVSCN